MKKLIYLFLALLIVACGSDDSTNDDSNQLFLEKYDGIVWQKVYPNGESRYTFTNNPKGLIYFTYSNYPKDMYQHCTTFVFGETYIYENGEEELITVLEENEDSIILLIQYDDEEPFPVYYTVSVNEDTLNIAYNDGANDDPGNFTNLGPIFSCY
jgi:hypothetical protein